MVTVYEDFDTLLPAPMAAARVSVSRQLINYWRSTGRLPDSGTPGRPLYRLGDLLRAEAAARRDPRSHRTAATA